jgi:hypothetical protein
MRRVVEGEKNTRDELNGEDADQNEAENVVVVETKVGQIHGYVIAEQ